MTELQRALEDYKNAELQYQAAQTCLIVAKDSIQAEMDKHFKAMGEAADRVQKSVNS